jgi:hypothetical protein
MNAPTFLGLHQLDWLALTALGGFALAAATTTAIFVTLHIARAGRRRDDVRRQEDRDHDAEIRRQDRERADQLRREDDEKWERRFRAEQRDREDYEARQVTVEFRPGGPLSRPGEAVTSGDGITHGIFVSAPASYPVRQVDACIASRGSSNLSITHPGWTFEAPVVQDGQVRYRCWAGVSGQLHDPVPIVRFVDRHGNLYYTMGGQTRRFPQNTDWIDAAAELDRWIRTGPKPDEPEQSA